MQRWPCRFRRAVDIQGRLLFKPPHKRGAASLAFCIVGEAVPATFQPMPTHPWRRFASSHVRSPVVPEEGAFLSRWRFAVSSIFRSFEEQR